MDLVFFILSLVFSIFFTFFLLEYLLFDLFPKTIELVKKFINLYDKYDIDLVFNYSLFSKKDFAAAAAAKINNKIKHVGFFHGVDAYKIKHRFFMEFIHFDIYFASTIGEVKEIQSLVREFGYSKPIVNSHPYLINNKAILNDNIDSDIKEKKENNINEKTDNDTDELNDNNKDQNIIETKNIPTKPKIKILNIILVFIISLIGLIIFLDTFKSPISFIIPNIEIILYNLYETLKDITLFLKDLVK